MPYHSDLAMAHTNRDRLDTDRDIDSVWWLPEPGILMHTVVPDSTPPAISPSPNLLGAEICQAAGGEPGAASHRVDGDEVYEETDGRALGLPSSNKTCGIGYVQGEIPHS